MTYEEFEKKCIASGETDLVYLRAWWDKQKFYRDKFKDQFKAAKATPAPRVTPITLAWDARYQRNANAMLR